jgi:hypothetical protein
MANPGNVITITLSRVEQLFNSLDPSPFYERDIDDEAERFIVGTAREMSAGQPLELVIHLPEPEIASTGAGHLPDAIRNYFGYRALQAQQELRELMRIGWRSLFIGLAVLLACLAAVRFIEGRVPASALGSFASQSLVILAWVANWRPLEIFLYDWWPIRRRIALLRRLSVMTVEVRAASDRPTA